MTEHRRSVRLSAIGLTLGHGRIGILRLFPGVLLAWLVAGASAAEAPIFDVHLHYTWSQAEVTSPERALGYLEEQGIDKAVVIGTPPELAARDPWRYVRNPIADGEERLLPEWDRLIQSFAKRFMIGADTVWPVDRGASWDVADTGWQELGRFITFHRRWTGYLSADIAEDIRWNNAANFFRVGSEDKR